MRIVFDLDGTLANTAHRQHFLEGDKKDWNGFFEACDKDVPIWPAIETMTALNRGVACTGDSYYHKVEIWSGRGEGKDGSVRRKTFHWLGKHCGSSIKFFDEKKEEFFSDSGIINLRMRPHGDHTPDEILKKAWLDASRAQNKEPHLIFDDRQKVVDMWRAEGIPCFQVAPGNF